jgi:hypothetical protein
VEKLPIQDFVRLAAWVDQRRRQLEVVPSAAGLRVASTVRLSRLDCLEQKLLRRRLGMVDQRDAGQLEQVWANEIRLRF